MAGNFINEITFERDCLLEYFKEPNTLERNEILQLLGVVGSSYVCPNENCDVIARLTGEKGGNCAKYYKKSHLKPTNSSAVLLG
jgi:hypothetical protein